MKKLGFPTDTDRNPEPTHEYCKEGERKPGELPVPSIHKKRKVDTNYASYLPG